MKQLYKSMKQNAIKNPQPFPIGDLVYDIKYHNHITHLTAK